LKKLKIKNLDWRLKLKTNKKFAKELRTKNINKKNGTNTRISAARGTTLEFKMPSMDLEGGESEEKKRSSILNSTSFGHTHNLSKEAMLKRIKHRHIKQRLTVEWLHMRWHVQLMHQQLFSAIFLYIKLHNCSSTWHKNYKKPEHKYKNALWHKL
jgi:hypothetical protein